MKTKLSSALTVLAALLLCATGCVRTVTGQKTAGMPFVKDTFENLYPKSPDVIFKAAKDVIREDGVLLSEGTIYDKTNAIRVVKGRVNESSVWVRVAPKDAKITAVAVQTRNSSGGSDMDLGHQIATEIAVRIAQP